MNPSINNAGGAEQILCNRSLILFDFFRFARCFTSGFSETFGSKTFGFESETPQTPTYIFYLFLNGFKFFVIHKVKFVLKSFSV